jgi:TolB-like protein
VKVTAPPATPSQPETREGLMPSQNSVAVLPFAVMSTGPDDEYFADGLTEEIINSLSQLPDLMVTARTSAFHFKGKSLPVGEIASQLGVDHILEGSIRRAGEQLRITAQLIRADDGFHLWSETYDRRTEDTFAVQDDISQKVAEALDVILDDAKRNSMRNVGVRNVEAFVAFQKGVDLYNRAHREPNQISLLRQANQYYEQAIGLYPEFSDAYLQHSDLYSHILLTQASGVLDGEITAEDIEAAPRHLRRDFDNSIRFARGAGQTLAAELDRALILGEWRGLKNRSERSLLAGGCETSLWSQLAAAAFGNAALARDAFKRTTICDPLLIRADVHLVQSMLWLGQWPDAITVAERQLAKNQHPWLIRSLALAQAMQGDFNSAENTLRQQTVSEEDLLFGLATLVAVEGNARAAANYSQEFLDKFGPNDELALRLEASRGNRNEANRLAAQIDGRPFGYIPLMQTVYSCACGAPFDLEFTPVFAGMLEESGLPWPPTSPIIFPLKDW